MQPRIALTTLLAVALLLVPGPRDRAEGALLGSVRLLAGGEYGSVRFDHLTEYTFFPLAGQPLDLRRVRLELDDGSAAGFYVGVALKPEFQVVWNRTSSETKYRLFLDDMERFSGDEELGLVLPSVDVRLDMISLGLRLPWKVGPVSPVVRTGYGWMLISQNGPLDLGSAASVRSGGRDYSDSDKVIEVTLGAVAEFGPARISAQARTLHSRWDAEDGFIPARITHHWVFSLRGGVAF